MPDINDAAWQQTERALCIRAQAGDQRAFTELYRAFAGPLFHGVLIRMLKNRAAAEDALADTFHAAWKKIKEFDTAGRSIWFWLHRIAHNTAISSMREAARAGRASANMEQIFPVVDPGDLGAALDFQRDCHKLRRLLARLVPPRYREALTLHKFENRERDECAALMGVQPLAFNKIFIRAVQALRKLWEEDGDGR